MASRTAGPSLRRAIHSSTSHNAPPLKALFRAVKPSSSSGDSQASTSTARLLPGAGSTVRAIDVSELPVLSKNKLKESEVGKAMVYSETFAKKILDDALPRTLRKDLSLTQRPTTVLRKATVAIVKDLKDGKQLKVVVGGKAGTGRSTVVLQTIASCQDSVWPVLHIPDANHLTDARYAFSQPKGSDKMYEQPVVAQVLLKRFLAANDKSALGKLDKAVLQAVEKGSKDLASASEALQKLLQSSSQKAPILLAIDSAEALYKTSKYVTVENVPIEPKNLAVPSLLRSCLEGSNEAYSSLATVAALDKASSLRVSSSKVAKVTPGPLTRTEAAGIYQHMADTLLLENEPSDTSFLENLVGSDGNALLFTRGLRAIPGATARGVVKKGKSRGTSVRNDKLHSITVTV